ncbi:MAG TPA: hypothetical protein VIP78_04300, partial [Candidatus Dormibacteraeota bacterium]
MGRIHGRRSELWVGDIDAVDRECLRHLAHVVAADLVAQPSRTRVDHHGHLPFVQPKPIGDGRLEDSIDDPDLNEMVSRPKGAQLALATFDRALADLTDVVHEQPATVLAMLKVVRVSISGFNGRHRAPSEDADELVIARLPDPTGAAAGRHPLAKGRHQLEQSRPHVIFLICGGHLRG